MVDLTHPYPIGLRVRNYGQQYPSAEAGTATITDNTIRARNGDQEYVVATDKPLYEGGPSVSQWSDWGTIPASIPDDHDHTAGVESGVVTCSCGFTGPEGPLSTAHFRAYGLCGECWGSGTDSYPCLGTCQMCGGSGDAEREAVAIEGMALAEAEIAAASDDIDSPLTR